jgi:hypothetical protein
MWEEDYWAEVKRFITEWYPIESRYGCSEQDIDRAEKRLGFALPSVLKKWHLLMGNIERNSYIWRHDFLVPMDECDMLISNEGIKVLWFFNENQGVDAGFILLDKRSMDDPPIRTALNAEERSSLSEFLFQAFLFSQEASWCLPKAYLVVAEEKLSELGLRKMFATKWDWMGNTYTFWHSGEILLIWRQNGAIWMTGKTREDLEELFDKMLSKNFIRREATPV